MGDARTRPDLDPRSGAPQLSSGERLAVRVTRWAGSNTAFGLAVASTAVWIATGPLFRWSDTWQLYMNTASSIVTFLMVFLIQRSQNKDTLAIHVKLDAILASGSDTNRGLVSVEELSEGELQRLKERFLRLVHDVEGEQTARAR
jgi:low affinity Fe/Cu permease